MKEQLKAEAFVRQQRPALMELSFGCEIWPNSHGGDIFTTSLWNLVAVDDRSLILRPKGESVDEDIQTVDIKYCKIIGHPIKLNDWLAVLDGQLDTCGKFYVIKRGERIGEDETEDEVVAIFNFDLTTGQPATEADYKAFNDIISV